MRDLSYGWNNGYMMKNALNSLNDESLRLMELISKDDKLPDWTLVMVSTALDRLTLARQHIESMLRNPTMKSNPAWWDKVKSALGFAKKASVKAAKHAGRFAKDRAIDAREAAAITKLKYDLDNLKKCAESLDMPSDQMKATRRYQELELALFNAQEQRRTTIESRKTREPIRNRRNPITKNQILEQLIELGFSNMAMVLSEENPPISDKRYFLADVEKAYRETTREEFPRKVYVRVMHLLDAWFEAKSNPRRKRKAGILRPRGEGFNEARQALRDEYREKYGSNWWQDKSLKDEMYDRLRDMGY